MNGVYSNANKADKIVMHTIQNELLDQTNIVVVMGQITFVGETKPTLFRLILVTLRHGNIGAARRFGIEKFLASSIDDHVDMKQNRE